MLGRVIRRGADALNMTTEPDLLGDARDELEALPPRLFSTGKPRPAWNDDTSPRGQIIRDDIAGFRQPVTPRVSPRNRPQTAPMAGAAIPTVNETNDFDDAQLAAMDATRPTTQGTGRGEGPRARRVREQAL